jgi:hypothetical protein
VKYIFHVSHPLSGDVLDNSLPWEAWPETVELEMNTYKPENGAPYLALKSEGISMERLRLIHGFEENVV